MGHNRELRKQLAAEAYDIAMTVRRNKIAAGYDISRGKDAKRREGKGREAELATNAYPQAIMQEQDKLTHVTPPQSAASSLLNKFKIRA